MNNMIVLNELESKLDTINSNLTGKIDTINTNSTAIKSVVDNIYGKVDTEIGTLLTNTNTNNTANASGTLSQKLSYIINNLLGAVNATGGSSTSGSMMAKLNALLRGGNYGTYKVYSANASGSKTTTLLNLSNIIIVNVSLITGTASSSSPITMSMNIDGYKYEVEDTESDEQRWHLACEEGDFFFSRSTYGGASWGNSSLDVHNIPFLFAKNLTITYSTSRAGGSGSCKVSCMQL